MSPTTLTGPEMKPRHGHAKRAVIFLHGYGSNGEDLLSLASYLDLPETYFLSPNAPFAFEMGYPGGYQWFGLADRDPVRIVREIKVAAPILNNFIDETMARLNLAEDKIALVGFSQGSMMSMYTSLRRPKPLGGVVAISGALKGGASLKEEITARPPICIIHGMLDEVVPFSSMKDAEDILKENNVPVETHARPQLGHSIDEKSLGIINKFLTKSVQI